MSQPYIYRTSTRHFALRALLRRLIRRCRRLAADPATDPALAASIRSQIPELEGVLHHHPLNDDLKRAIAAALRQGIRPAERTSA